MFLRLGGGVFLNSLQSFFSHLPLPVSDIIYILSSPTSTISYDFPFLKT